MARAIGSIIWTSFTSGTKMLTKLYLTLRRGRRIVKRGSQAFYESLVEYGIPQEFAQQITGSYAGPGLEMLRIRRIISMVRELGVD